MTLEHTILAYKHFLTSKCSFLSSASQLILSHFFKIKQVFCEIFWNNFNAIFLIHSTFQNWPCLEFHETMKDRIFRHLQALSSHFNSLLCCTRPMTRRMANFTLCVHACVRKYVFVCVRVHILNSYNTLTARYFRECLQCLYMIPLFLWAC